MMMVKEFFGYGVFTAWLIITAVKCIAETMSNWPLVRAPLSEFWEQWQGFTFLSLSWALLLIYTGKMQKIFRPNK